MHPGTGGFIDDLTMSMETYVDYMMSAFFNLFKFMFCEYDVNGNITGLNLLGSIVIIMLAILIIGAIIRYLLETFTPWHHEDDVVTVRLEEETIKDPTEITEEEESRLVHQFYYNERRKYIWGKIASYRNKLKQEKIQREIQERRELMEYMNQQKYEREKKELKRLKEYRKLRKK